MAFTDRQRRVLSALCDTLVPSLEETPDPDGFWKRRASDIGVPTLIEETLEKARLNERERMLSLLDLLDTEAVGATWGGPEKRFVDLAAPDRERLLLSWKDSPVEEHRAALRALAGPVLGLFYAAATPEQDNPNWKSIGYPGPRTPPPPKADRPIRPLTVERDSVLDADVVVVGSGAGGGVVAGELTRAGLSVVVLEKGRYIAEDGFTQREGEMMGALYEGGGSIKTRDGAVTLLAGSSLGGGTTVNWTGALRTPDYVLDEWAKDHGCPHFLTPMFQRSLDAILAETHVTADETWLSGQGRALERGARALGYRVNRYPRNVKGCDESTCGYCVFGCQRGAKQGTLKTYLKIAAEGGARILVETEVRRVLTEAGVAVGVEAIHRDASGQAHAITVRARRVVVAAGSLHTPALLRRSGLRHEWIGKNLRLHPASSLVADYDEIIDPWAGVPMPVACDEFTRLDGNYGFKLINAPLHPSWLALSEWMGGRDHKERLLRSRHACIISGFVRDRDSGEVTVDDDGNPVVDYFPSAYDMGHVRRALAEAARIHLAAGAGRIYFMGGRVFDTKAGSAALERLIGDMDSWSWERHSVSLSTAHQMGTCRMGGDARTHPLSPDGETREIRNLFVADGSVLPTCSGANPMPTIEAIAHYTAAGIAARA